MPLILCPDCGRSVSDQAPSCVHCGAPLVPGLSDDAVLFSQDGFTVTPRRLTTPDGMVEVADVEGVELVERSVPTMRWIIGIVIWEAIMFSTPAIAGAVGDFVGIFGPICLMGLHIVIAAIRKISKVTITRRGAAAVIFRTNDGLSASLLDNAVRRALLERSKREGTPVPWAL